MSEPSSKPSRHDSSRRKLITTGLAAAAGVTGLGVAARLAQKHGLVPPDHGGIFGLGETLTYASQRLLTRHFLAREFSRSLSIPATAKERSSCASRHRVERRSFPAMRATRTS